MPLSVPSDVKVGSSRDDVFTLISAVGVTAGWSCENNGSDEK